METGTESTRYKIVMVDDNVAMLDQGKHLLQSAYRVYTFSSAALLFDYLEHDMPELILLDVEMPGMNGFEAIEQLKSNPKYRDIPVIFLTSQSDEKSEQRGFMLGAVDYIIKPFSGPLLQKRISNQILYKRVHEETVKEMRRAEFAEMANLAKTQFLTMMSHELRTPMNSITGFAELALGESEGSASPKIRNYLTKILESSRWFLRIANDILDISKIESGKMELERIPFDLHDVFSRCHTVILPDAMGKGLDYRVYLEPLEGENLIGDPLRLYQALVNLLFNAVKFTNEGIINLAALPRKTSENRAAVYFEVKDTGIGISAEKLRNLFEPFTQADISTTRTYGGTGLGLSIAKNIIELMGGSLSVKSEVGAGSTFSFEIEFDTVNVSSDGPVSAMEEPMEKPVYDGLILVCDDNLYNQEVVCEHLARVGIKTITAENGREGVNIVQERKLAGKKPFDLIFMDIFMPAMDGIEATSEIIASGVNTPIIAMTANIMASELEKYKERGMPDCLNKPFTARDLWDLLRKYLTPIEAGDSQTV